MSSNETLRKFMKAPVTVYNITENLLTVVENVHLQTAGVWASAVQDENGKIIGGIDFSYLDRIYLEDESSSGYKFQMIPDKDYAYHTIEDIVIRYMPIFSPETPVKDARRLMYSNHFTQRALIIENDKVVGTVSIRDLPDIFRGVTSPKGQYI